MNLVSELAPLHHDIDNPALFKMDQALQMTRVSTDETNVREAQVEHTSA